MAPTSQGELSAPPQSGLNSVGPIKVQIMSCFVCERSQAGSISGEGGDYPVPESWVRAYLSKSIFLSLTYDSSDSTWGASSASPCSLDPSLWQPIDRVHETIVSFSEHSGFVKSDAASHL